MGHFRGLRSVIFVSETKHNLNIIYAYNVGTLFVGNLREQYWFMLNKLVIDVQSNRRSFIHTSIN